MTQAVSTVSCPRCSRINLTALAREEDRQRYQCNDCGENFTAPAPAQTRVSGEASPEASVAPVPISIPGPDAFSTAHVPIGIPGPDAFSTAHVPIGIPEPDASGIVGRCPKCQKPYYRLGKRFEGHVAGCDGTPYVTRGKFSAAAPAEAGLVPLPAAPAITGSATPPEVTKAFNISIEALKVQRAVLEAEIQSINGVIATLEKLRSPGGASLGAPFRNGA